MSADAAEQLPHSAARHRLRLSHKRIQRQDRLLTGGNLRLFQQPFRRSIQRFFILPQQLRRAAHILHGPRVQLPQNRQNLMAQHVPRRVVHPVGGIFHIGDVMRPGIIRQLLTGHLQERPQEILPFRRDAGEPPQPRPPQEIQQHGFRIVIGVVGCQYAAASQRRFLLVEKGVPGFPRRLFQRQPLPGGQRPDVSTPGNEGDLMGAAPVPDEPLVPV